MQDLVVELVGRYVIVHTAGTSVPRATLRDVLERKASKAAVFVGREAVPTD